MNKLKSIENDVCAIRRVKLFIALIFKVNK